MISIITAIYNQLAMNRLFWETLVRNTDGPFELIVIDNGSTDGSRAFFTALAASDSRVHVITNSGNYSYPHCQNQGIAIAKFDAMAFLNNDLLVPPHWDTRVLMVLGKDHRDVLSVGSNDRLADKPTTKRLSRRWKYIKYPLISLFGQSYRSLKAMVWLCYGNFDRYAERIFRWYGYSMTIGFSGSAIIMNRRALEKIGPWDPAMQSADFDTYYRTCHRAETVGDIQPLFILNGVFVHHYRRLTLYHSNYPPFQDADRLRDLKEKWSPEQLERWSRAIAFKD